jgi:anti-sigma B factor antagonist
LSALIDVTGDAREHSKPLRIVVDAHHPVIRPIQLTGLESYLALCNSVADALGPQP